MSDYFPVGSEVICRFMWRGTPNAIVSRVVVEDTEVRTVLWMPPGARYDVMSVPRVDRIKALADGAWPMATGTAAAGVLQVIPAGAGYALEPQFGEEGNVAGWYVNLQEPLRRTAEGFDSMDLQLDVLANRYGDRWHEKDRSEFDAMVQVGLRPREEAERIVGDGAAAIALIQTRIADRWDQWRPPESRNAT